MPITLHEENSLDNARMAKRKAMPKHRGMVRIMRPEVVLKKLEELGISITQRTLQRYAKAGLIPKPETKPAGRGKGKITEHPEGTIEETAAVRFLKNNDYFKLKEDGIKKVREIAHNPFPEMLYDYAELSGPLAMWTTTVEKVKKGLPLEKPIKVRLNWRRERSDTGEKQNVFAGIDIKESDKDRVSVNMYLSEALENEQLKKSKQ